jgi:hypothetical protein
MTELTFTVVTGIVRSNQSKLVSHMKELHHTVKPLIVDTPRSDGASFAGIEPLHNGYCFGGWRNMV